MKRAFLIALSALLLMALPGALAEVAEPPAVPFERLPPLEVEINPQAGVTRSLPTTEETVVIENGNTFTITSKGITFKQELPFGWFGFSQDVNQQLNDYMSYFKDPRAALDYVFNIDLSLLVLNTANNYQVLVYTRQNDTSKFFGSLSEEATYQTAMAYFQKNFPDAGIEAIKSDNGNNYVRTVELYESGQYSVIYFTYVNGTMLGFELLTRQEELLPEHEELLLSVVSLVELL